MDNAQKSITDTSDFVTVIDPLTGKPHLISTDVQLYVNGNITHSSMWPSEANPSGALNYSKKFDVLLNMIKNVGETGGTFIIEYVWIDEDGRHQTSSHVVTATHSHIPLPEEVQTKPIIQPQHS